MTDIDPFALDTCIRDSGISFKENAQSFIFDCPRCGKAGKLYIRKKDGRFVCWVCAETEGFAGSAEWALTELLSLPVGELRAQLGISNTTPQATSELAIPLRDWFFNEGPMLDDREVVEFDLKFLDITDPSSLKGREYLAARGISLEIAVEYNLKFEPTSGRVIIPVVEKGKLYGWQARATRPTEWRDRFTGEERKVPKILSLQTMQKGRHLMFYDRLVGSEHAVICEGPFDALKCHLIGGNVATMGKVVSDAQVALILDSGVKKVYLALDPDAIAEIELLATKLYDVEVYVLLPADGYKDLGEMPMEAVLERFETAPRLDLGVLRPPLLSATRHPL